MTDDETIKDRLIATFEMFEFGVEMMAATLRRRHPHASPEQIEQLLEAWLLERPGAEAGDGPGVALTVPCGTTRTGLPIGLQIAVDLQRRQRPRAYAFAECTCGEITTARSAH